MTAVDSVWARAAELLDPPPWEPTARPPLLDHQQPPSGPFGLWVMVAGRGSGKTEACARYYARWMREHPTHRGRIIAPTLGDAIEACVQGPSGLKAIDPDVVFRPSAPGGSKVVWPNGSEALLLGTDQPNSADRFRAGGNRHIDWWEEMAACRYLTATQPDRSCWEQAQLGLRLGTRPHSIASTTPRNRRGFRDLLTDDDTVITRAKLADNPHVNAAWRAKMEKRYAGTRIGRQELGGELLDDVPGALWQSIWIDAYRVPLEQVPDLVRVVVAVDPAVTSGEHSDETGIVVAGRDIWGHGYVLADKSLRGTPHEWATAAVQAYRAWEADAIIGEVNNGGDLVETTVRSVDKRAPFTDVRASRGKQVRAAPVSALYEVDADDPLSTCWVHHVGAFPELEDQLTTWVPGESTDDSPDRLDALVWALTDLLVEDISGPATFQRPTRRVPSVTPR